MAAHRFWRLFIYTPNDPGLTVSTICELEMFDAVGGANVCTSGTAISSSDHPAPWTRDKAFNGVKTGDEGWASGVNQQYNCWIGYDFGAGNAKDVVEFAIISRINSLGQTPKDFELQYSDDGYFWSLGTRINNQTGWTANETRVFSYADAPLPEVRIISHFKSYHEPRFEIHNLPPTTIRSAFVGEGKVSGRITVGGSIANNALVRLIHSNSGVVVQETTSNVLGMYEFNNVKLDELYDVVAEDPLKEWEKVVSSRRTPLFEFKMRPKMHDGAHVYIPYMAGIHHPTFSNVKSLLQGAGADGSTTITDDTGRSWTQVGNLQVDDSLGVNLLLSDGANDRASTTYVYEDFNWWTSDFTIEAWVQASSWTNWGSTTSSALVGNYAHDAGTNYWSFGPLTNGKLGFYYYNGSSVPNSFGTIPTGEIVHIAMTYSGGNIYLGINGEVSQPIAVSGTPQSSNSYPLGIGQHNGSHCPGYFAIRISREALYKYAYEVPELNVPSS